MPPLSKASTRQILRALQPHTEFLQDYSGGLNVRDPVTSLAPNEFPYGYNMTLNERGLPSKRLGSSLYNPLNAWGIAGTPKVKYLYWSQVFNRTFMYCGDDATIGELKSAIGNSAWTSVKTGQSPKGAAFVDFKGYLVFVDPDNGVYTWDGAAFTLRNATVKGNCIAVWQNKVWVAGDTTNPTRVWWCNPGDPTTWTIATDFVDVREGGDDQLTALAPSAGMDILGRAGLLCFKAKSVHRINSSSTGSYTTLSLECGAISNRSLCALGDLVAHLDARGIWMTPASAGTPVKVSGKLDPLFGPLQATNFIVSGSGGTFPAGTWRDRMLFTMNTDNYTLLLEYHPGQHWIVAHPIASWARGGIVTDAYAGSANANGAPLLIGCASASGAGTVRMFDPAQGLDVTGAAFASTLHVPTKLRTRSLLPGGGNKMRLEQARIIGRGEFSVAPVFDYAVTAGTARNVDLGPTNLVPDPSFESNGFSAGWINGGCTIAAGGSQDGTYHAEGVSDGSGTDDHHVSTSSPGMAVDPSKTYTVSAYFKKLAGAGTPNSRLDVFFYDAASVLISSATIIAAFTPTGSWVRKTSALGAIPAGTAFVRLAVYAQINSPGVSTVGIDAVQFEQGPVSAFKATPDREYSMVDELGEGTARAFALEFSGLADDTVYTRPGRANLIDAGQAEGGWQLAGVLLEFVGQGQDAKL